MEEERIADIVPNATLAIIAVIITLKLGALLQAHQEFTV